MNAKQPYIINAILNSSTNSISIAQLPAHIMEEQIIGTSLDFHIGPGETVYPGPSYSRENNPNYEEGIKEIEGLIMGAHSRG